VLLQLEVVFRAVDEAALAVIRCLATKACVAVEHWQQGQADTAAGGGLADASGQFGGVGVGLAVAVVMHVVEFSYRGVAGLEHFDIQLAGDDFQLLGIDLAHQAVHQVAPGPEAVIGVAGHFRQPGHGPLECMGVQVGHARQQRALEPFRAVCAGVGLDLCQLAVSADFKAYMVGPAIRQQCTFGEKGGHGSSTLSFVICIYIYRRLPAR